MKFILFFLTLLFAFSAHYTQPPENTNSSTNFSNQESLEETEIQRIAPSIEMDSVSMKIKSESTRDYKNITPKGARKVRDTAVLIKCNQNNYWKQNLRK